MWCSSGLIFGYYCGGGLCLGQVKCVPFYLMMAPLEAVNHCYHMLQLEPLDVWYHIVIVVGSGVLVVATYNSYTYLTMALNVRSYTYCINLHAEGG